MAELRASEQQFRALLESAPDAALIVDAAGGILLVSGYLHWRGPAVKFWSSSRDERWQPVASHCA